MEVDLTSHKKNEHSNSEPEVVVENEEILVYVNFEDLNDDYSNADLTNFKVLGLDTDEPILQIGDKAFGGNWVDTVGTAVFFEETAPPPKRCYFSADVAKPLKYLAKTHKCLSLKRIFVSSKDDTPETKHDFSITENEETAHTSNIEKKKDDTDTTED